MRVQVRVNEVLEVGQAVLGGHVEQGIYVLALPLKIRGDVVGGDREGKYAPVGVTGSHNLNESLVDDVHFRLQIAVGEVHEFVAD